MRCYTTVLAILVWPVLGAKETEVMSSFSKVIGGVVLKCKLSMQLDKEIVVEFLKFWDTKHELMSKDLGCVVACILKNLQFLDTGGKIEESQVHAFLKANGAGDSMITKLTQLYVLCNRAAITRKQVHETADGCIFALEAAKCFRYGIFKLNWAPEFNNQDLKHYEMHYSSEKMARPDVDDYY